MTITLAPQLAYLFMIVFARIGTMMMLMPAFGEKSIPVRVRLTIALAVTLIMVPLVRSKVGPVPESLNALGLMFFWEMGVGFALGSCARLVVSTLHTAGTTIAFQAGLGFATAFDATQGSQGALIGNFLSLVGLTLIFVLDMHHVILGGIYDSYTLFTPGARFPVGDFSQLALETVSESFKVAMQLAAPFIVFGLVFYVGLGVLARLMPQLQVFFVAMPINIMIGFLLLMVLLAAIMNWYMDYFGRTMEKFLVG